MLLVDADNLTAMAQTPLSPLPWEWFDIAAPASPIDPRRIRSVDQGGAQQAWNVTIDGRQVPFKFLRGPVGGGGGAGGGTSPAPRPALIMMHGLGLTIATFRGVSHHLLATHDLVLVDYSSFSSPAMWPHPVVGMKDLAHSVWVIADALGLGRVSLAGNSLGGGLSLTAALLQPERVDRLLLVNPACYPQELPRTFRIARVPLLGELFMHITPAERFVAGIETVSYVDKSRFVEPLRSRYLANMAVLGNRLKMMNIIRQLPCNPRDCTPAPHLPRLRHLHRPVYVGWGVQDLLLAPGSGERLAADLPDVMYEPYADLAHMPHEEAPDRIGRRWAAFLNLDRPSRQ